jgi:fatty aldehyde-generating acyl-ACP reductase
MDHQSSSIDFAVIGHQENWEKISAYVRLLRIEGTNPGLPEECIKNVFSFIPPRPLFEIVAVDSHERAIRGVYIETFISPDELDAAHLYKNLKKVQDACEIASTLKAGIAALGGFTSIVLESGKGGSEKIGDTWFTTGNSLTASYVVEAVENACHSKQIRLNNATLLVVGSTGDIGRACVSYFTHKVREIRLCARQQGPLQKQAVGLMDAWQLAKYGTEINDLFPGTDVVVCVASSILEQADFDRLPPGAILCDAGYPKNIGMQKTLHHSLFYGGMGKLSGTYEFIPGNTKSLYGFPVPNVVHGCLLEAITLCFANKPGAFSKGKGNITLKNMRYINDLAKQHGITVAPLFNESSCWK